MPFDFDKISSAIFEKAMAASEGGRDRTIELWSRTKWRASSSRFAKKYKNFLPTVEGIQDSVEKYLHFERMYVKTAKSYILYRDKRAQLRATKVGSDPSTCRKLSAGEREVFQE